MRDAERHPWRAEARHIWRARGMRASGGSGHPRPPKTFNLQGVGELQVAARVPRRLRSRWLAPCDGYLQVIPLERTGATDGTGS
jgi:hypothetical protein